MRRRNFLRGIGGATLALPMLEAFTPTRAAKAGASGTPQRFVYMFGGVSTGRSIKDGPTPSGDWITPTVVGTDYDLRESLQPLQARDVAAHTSIVTGLVLPWGDTGNVPPGGRHVEFHAHSTCPLVCGMRSKGPTDESASGPSVDQVVANELAGDTLHPALAFRVQAVNYRGCNGDGGNRGRITYRRNAEGKIEKIDPIVSPRLAFESLFGNFVPADPAQAAAAAFAFKTRRSVLDVVSEDTARLLPKLGAMDRQRIERHFHEIRALEKRLDAAPPEIGGGCQLPADPGEDPPIGAANENQQEGYDTSAGYSDEELRADILLELVRMAFACDLSRVASVMLTMAQCFMNMYQLFGHAIDFHNSGHGNVNNAIWHADAVGWHVDQFAKLLAGLRDTPDLDGRTLLDNTAVVLVFEGGHGYDPATGNNGSPHSTENMVALVGGHAGGLSSGGGRHVRAAGRNPVEVVNTAMAAVGVEGGLGEVEGTIDALFG